MSGSSGTGEGVKYKVAMIGGELNDPLNQLPRLRVVQHCRTEYRFQFGTPLICGAIILVRPDIYRYQAYVLSLREDFETRIFGIAVLAPPQSVVFDMTLMFA